MKLLVATHNRKKQQELLQFLPEAIEIFCLDDLHVENFEIIEDGTRFIDNAFRKVHDTAKYLSTQHRFDIILADDSGLCVEALNGAPGVRSARYAFDHDASEGDDANSNLLLEQMKVHTNRRAYFQCVLALYLPEYDLSLSCAGRCMGLITHEPRGTNGFGYDPIFIPDAFSTRTMAELTAEEKNKCSHRSIAFEKLQAIFPLIQNLIKKGEFI